MRVPQSIFLFAVMVGGLLADRPPNDPARPLSTPPAKYPDSLINSLARGFASVRMFVDEQGKVVRVEVLRATHPDFVPPAIDAISQWKFEPALRNGQPIGSSGIQNIWFDVHAQLNRSIGSYDFGFKPTAKGKVPKEFRYDQEPDVLTVVNVVYPFDLLVAGVAGSAVVDVTIDPLGNVIAADVVEATHPDFGRALQAMAFACHINPATLKGRPVGRSFMRRKQAFGSGMNQLRFDDQTKKIMAELAQPRSRIVEAATLIEQPVARYQPAPKFPVRLLLERRAGEAVVEFIIDHRGRVQLPRILSATADEFGWAAATAVLQWAYQPPVQDGQPVWVREKKTFQFALPTAPGRG